MAWEELGGQAVFRAGLGFESVQQAQGFGRKMWVEG